VVPRALLYTILINGALAFAMVIALMFCLSDVTTVVASADTLFYPFLEIFYQAVQSLTGAGLLAGIVLVLAIASVIGVYASASRMLWSFSRDLGLPFSVYLVRVSPVLKVTATKLLIFTSVFFLVEQCFPTCCIYCHYTRSDRLIVFDCSWVRNSIQCTSLPHHCRPLFLIYLSDQPTPMASYFRYHQTLCRNS